MTIKIDTDLILPILITVAVAMFVPCYQLLTPKSTIVELLNENDVLFQEVSSANREIDYLTRELEGYKATEATLVRMGASHIEAQRVIIASEVYGVDPKPMEH